MKRFFFLFAGLIVTTFSFADTITLTDGSVLVGSVKKMTDADVTIATKFAGEISIPWGEVTAIDTETVLPVHLSDGSIIMGTLSTDEEGEMTVTRGQDTTGFSITGREVTAINPPPPPEPEQPKWKGKVIGNLLITDGNSDVMNIGVTANASRRSEFDRIALAGGYAIAEDEGRDTRDEQFVSGKYDYFFSKKLFGYLNSRLDRDIIRDLNMRTTAGAGVGYQFIEDDVYNFFTEAGLSYVNEDFIIEADDSDYMSGRLGYHFDWWIIEDDLQLNHNTEVLVSVQDTEDWIALTDLLLTWKWTEQWSLNGGVRFEWDNTPAQNNTEEDIEYLLGVGYSF